MIEPHRSRPTPTASGVRVVLASRPSMRLRTRCRVRRCRRWCSGCWNRGTHQPGLEIARTGFSGPQVRDGFAGFDLAPPLDERNGRSSTSSSTSSLPYGALRAVASTLIWCGWYPPGSQALNIAGNRASELPRLFQVTNGHWDINAYDHLGKREEKEGVSLAHSIGVAEARLRYRRLLSELTEDNSLPDGG